MKSDVSPLQSEHQSKQIWYPEVICLQLPRTLTPWDINYPTTEASILKISTNLILTKAIQATMWWWFESLTRWWHCNTTLWRRGSMAISLQPWWNTNLGGISVDRLQPLHKPVPHHSFTSFGSSLSPSTRSSRSCWLARSLARGSKNRGARKTSSSLTSASILISQMYIHFDQCFAWISKVVLEGFPDAPNHHSLEFAQKIGMFMPFFYLFHFDHPIRGPTTFKQSNLNQLPNHPVRTPRAPALVECWNLQLHPAQTFSIVAPTFLTFSTRATVGETHRFAPLRPGFVERDPKISP